MKNSNGVKLHFFGGAKAVTGVCYMLETENYKILVDCGLFQGEKELEKRNYEPFTFEPKEIDAVIISHSHLDHIGRLPQLIKEGFAGRIYATPPTIEFTRLILEDSVKILEEKAMKANVVPFFDMQNVERVMEHFMPVEYYRKTKISEGVEFTFHEAGHILGSAITEIETAGKKIVFSGDLGHPPVPFLRPPDFLEQADYVVVESTYGDKNHEPALACKEVIENAIEETIAKKGVLMIPSFAMERTQQLLYHLNELAENHRIPAVPVFIDSPLAIKITEVYKKFPQYYNNEAAAEIKSGDDLFNFAGLRLTRTSRESKEINDIPSPKIIIAGSGMSQGGRIVHHEVRYLSEPRNTLLLITYQAEGTLGRRIAEGAKRVEILDQPVAIRAKIQAISGYSAHADQRFLMEWLGHFQKICFGEKKECVLKNIFICQGEARSANVLAGLVRDELGVKATVPEMGEVAELE